MKLLYRFFAMADFDASITLLFFAKKKLFNCSFVRFFAVSGEFRIVRVIRGKLRSVIVIVIVIVIVFVANYLNEKIITLGEMRKIPMKWVFLKK